MELKTIRSQYTSGGTIARLPMFEEDADPERRDVMTDEEIYANKKPPTSIVVRYGVMKLVAEYPYDGPSKPGCGSKLVIRTNRGLEIGEMLTTTCTNSGCGKSITRNEMLGYIENSGGTQYPFRTDGKIMRVASVEDLNRWSEIQTRVRARKSEVVSMVADAGFGDAMKVVELEPILSEEQLAIYYTAEDRVDFREMVQQLAKAFGARIEMRQVGARDEARLVADYEKCGQHCCCQNFLKVLKPVSMRSAKVQKATLDPLKISGRCGRLMCCLRYEDETYSELKKKLPHKKSRVGTPEGPGLVIDSKILVQLVLVKLESDGRQIAVPVEELCDPDAPIDLNKPAHRDPLRGMPVEELQRGSGSKKRRKGRSRKSKGEQQDAYRAASQAEEAGSGSGTVQSDAPEIGDPPAKKKRRRRRKKKTTDGTTTPSQGDSNSAGSEKSSEPSNSTGAAPKKKRRRRRRKKSSPGDQAPPEKT